jgi:hypothetical protein
LFHGHEIRIGSEFSISGTNDATPERLTVSVLEKEPKGQSMVQKEYLVAVEALRLRRSRRWLQLRFEGSTVSEDGLMITPDGSWYLDDTLALLTSGREGKESDEISAPNMMFLPTRSLENQDIIRLLNEIKLNPEEQPVLEALRIIEPNIEGIATAVLSEEHLKVAANSGVFVKLKGRERRLPIGSIGAGASRILGLLLALVKCRGGILMVDEIEVGLHYSVQAAMWRVVLETARRLQVQVFATTHSRDCVDALAQIARREVTESNEVSLQRIERDRAVAYSESAIIAAAEHGIEVR